MKEFTIDNIQKMISSKEFSARILVEEFLARISEIDKNGPKINSIIEINPDALQIADTLDLELKNNHVRGPLHGIPILIKENINTADKMMTTAGSLALKGNKPSKDAFIVQQLRKAGALILGKTNLSEWANFRASHSSSGWSSRGGQTKNPYVLDRSPCGSSSGSAVAVAANLCIGAIGTETDGSIVCPATANSIVGLKPTIGLVSRSGIIPISHTQDTAGPMARTVKDVAYLLNALVGQDIEDVSTVNVKSDIPKDYTTFLDRNGMQDARIGVARNYMGRRDFVDKIIEKAIDKMKDLGAIIIDPTNITPVNKFDDPEFEVLLFDFKNDINEYLKKYCTLKNIQDLTDLIEYNKKLSNKIMPYFGQEVFEMAQKKGPLTTRKYKKALAKCNRLSRKNIDKVIKKYTLDAIIAPTGGPAWPIDLINGDHFVGSSSSPVAVAGYPNITVPAGYIHELPIGISFFSGALQEPTLLKLAYAFEQATKIRQPPKYLPTLPL